MSVNDYVCAMILILKGMIEEDQSCLSNAALYMKQDTLHQYRINSI